MSAVIPNGYGQVRFQQEVPGQSGDVMCIFGFRSNTEFDPYNLASIFSDFWQSSVLPSQSDTATLLGVTVVFNVLGDLLEGFYINGNPGDVSGDVMPPNVAILVRKLSSFAGRQNRGRFYIPGVPKEAVQNAGLFEDTPRAALQDDLNAGLAGLILNDVDLAILHDENGPYAADAPAIVTSLYVESKTATQRTRLRD